MSIIEQMDILITEKVDLILLLAGEKQATEIDFYSRIYSDQDKTKVVNQRLLNQTKECLEQLPVAYSQSQPRHDVLQDTKTLKASYRQLITLQVAKSQTGLSNLQKATTESDDLVLGRLYGFPDTAIEAYIKNSTIDTDDLPDNVLKSPEFLFAQFALSKTHWKQELETATRWANRVKSYSPNTYRKFVKELKNERYSR